MDVHTFIYAIALGIVQGISEFLPVSSSGHLVVISWLMDGKPLPLVLNVALHLGTLGAVLFYFWKDWIELLKSVILRFFRKKPSFSSDTLLPAIIIGTLPAAVIGLLWEHEIEALFHNPLSVSIPLLLVGILFVVVDRKTHPHRSIQTLTIKDGLIIGAMQAVALIPGVSRSGITILTGLILGYKRPDAAKFSFLLATPAMFGASLLHAKDILANIGDPVFYVGIIVSCIIGCFSIGFLMRFFARFGLTSFAIYRGILAVLICLFVVK